MLPILHRHHLQVDDEFRKSTCRSSDPGSYSADSNSGFCILFHYRRSPSECPKMMTPLPHSHYPLGWKYPISSPQTRITSSIYGNCSYNPTSQRGPVHGAIAGRRRNPAFGVPLCNARSLVARPGMPTACSVLSFSANIYWSTMALAGRNPPHEATKTPYHHRPSPAHGVPIPPKRRWFRVGGFESWLEWLSATW